MRSILFLFGSFCLFQIAFAQEPKAIFKSSTNKLILNTAFVANCRLENPPEHEQYIIEYYLVSANESFGGMKRLIAEYYLYQGATTPTFDSSLAYWTEGGLELAQGFNVTWPEFEARINPKTNTARGNYSCAILVIDASSFAKQYSSDSWNTELDDGNTPKPEASFQTNTDQFMLGNEFVANCRLDNPPEHHGYEVAFDLISVNSSFGGEKKPIARWAQGPDENAPKFESLPDWTDGGLEVRQGNWAWYPEFEVKINPNTNTARGNYSCVVTINVNGVGDLVEYQSNSWDTGKAPEPMAVFTSRTDQLILDTKFLTLCRLDNPPEHHGCVVTFDLLSANSSFGEEKQPIARYVLGPDETKATFESLANWTDGGLEVLPSYSDWYPEFGLAINPKTNTARGNYSCSITVNDDVGGSIKYESGSWDTGFEPEAIFTPSSDQLILDTEFVANCRLENPPKTPPTRYTVIFDFISANLFVTGRKYTIARYLLDIDELDPKFESNTDWTQGGLEVAQGEKSSWAEFEIKINPKTDTARGNYSCRFLVYYTGIGYIEYNSTSVWDTGNDLVTSEPLVQFAVTPIQFVLGVEFTAKCYVNIGGYDSPTKAYGYEVVFGVEPIDWTQMDQFRKTSNFSNQAFIELAKWIKSNMEQEPVFTREPSADFWNQMQISPTGQSSIIPNFQMKMLPLAETARGKYLCQARVYEKLETPTIYSKRSNFWNTDGESSSGIGVLPSAGFLVVCAIFVVMF